MKSKEITARYEATEAAWMREYIADGYGLPENWAASLSDHDLANIVSTLDAKRSFYLLVRDGVTMIIYRLNKQSLMVSGATRYHDQDDAAEMFAMLAQCLNDNN